MAALLAEAEVEPFKRFLQPLLQNIGDDAIANSEILSDYVCTLLTTQLAPVNELQKVLADQLEDFLGDDTTKFVSDVFQGLIGKKHLAPLAASGPSQRSQLGGLEAVPTGPADSQVRENRKRGFGEHEGQTAGQDPHYGRSFSGDRSKQARRGARGGAPNGHPLSVPPLLAHPQPQAAQPFLGQAPGSFGMSEMPFPSPVPFNPNDPASAMLAMQAMGMPFMPMPGMSSSPPQASGQSNRSLEARIDSRSYKPCHAYVKRGSCSRENCPYNHDPALRSSASQPDEEMAIDGEYDPNAPTVGQTTVQSPPPSYAGNQQYPRRGDDHHRGRGRGRGGAYEAGKRGGKMDFSSTRPSRDRTKTTICVEKIPTEYLSEAQIRAAFQDFGGIESVEVQASRQLALIKFAQWDGAKAAFDSPKVLFDNRFVKVYWFDPERERHKRQHWEERAGSGLNLDADEEDAMEVDMDEVNRKTAEAQKAYEEKQAAKKKAEGQIKELEAKRDALLKSQAEETKRLLEKLAAKEKLAATANGSANGVSEEQLSPEDERKRAQTAALRAQVAALENEAMSLGLSTDATSWQTEATGYEFSGRGRGRGRGGYGYRGGYRGRGEFRNPAVKRADFRPRKLQITGAVGANGQGWNNDKDESMRQWLMTNLGQDIESVEPIDDATGLVVAFKERWMAEKCAGMINGVGSVEGVGRLTVGWVQNTPTRATNRAGIAVAPAIEDRTEMDLDRAVD